MQTGEVLQTGNLYLLADEHLLSGTLISDKHGQLTHSVFGVPDHETTSSNVPVSNIGMGMSHIICNYIHQKQVANSLGG